MVSQPLFGSPGESKLHTDNQQRLDEYRNLAHLSLENPDSTTLATTEKYIKLALECGTLKDQADAYHCDGLANKLKENMVNAITSFLQEHSLRKALNDDRGLADACYYIGDCYRVVFDIHTSEDFLNSAYKLFNELNDSLGICKTLNRMAAVNIDSRDSIKLILGYTLAIRSQAIALKLKDYDLQVNNLILMGSYHNQKNEPMQAIELFREAEKILPMAKEQFHLSLILCNMSGSYYRAGLFDEAIFNGMRAYQNALKTGYRVYQWLSCWSLYKSYVALNETDSMFKYQALGLLARVSIDDDIREKQKNLIEERFLKEKFGSDLKNQKNRTQLVVLIMIFSILFIAGILISFYIRNQRLKKINKILSDQNQIIETQKEELTQLTIQKDKFYSIIAHDLRSPFNGLLGITELLAEEFEGSPDSKHFTMVQNLNQSAQKLYQLLENLLQWAQLQQGVLKAKPEYLPLASSMAESIQTMMDVAIKKGISLQIDIPDSIYVFADRLMLESIVRNLIWNGVKFTPNGGKVKISAKKEPSKMIGITITDTGIGMNRKILENLFRFDKSINRPGTDGEPSSGLGLMICKEFIEQNHGEISVQSQQGKGSTFTFTLPEN